ncbi:hypothetical protein OK351_12640 [Glutamicibacter sp. MNS18]|uniref:hypothetical protein n=1 Tax=Glutamicibacter sp. MNS18 TaxID=2989817 RepID=UPI002236413F|nr:hypothetical protein [Glutamicibacter sp. MNS18]MCW4466345.1 hypothetical protein [Glutamicibacter sp. MNS18]
MQRNIVSVFTVLEPPRKDKADGFEIVRVRCCQSDLEHLVVPTVEGSLATLTEGMFLIGRFCPIAGTAFWTPSGPTNLLPASAHPTVAAMVQEDVLKHPELTHRNPEYLQPAREQTAQIHERFIAQNATNLIFGSGENLARRYADAAVDSANPKADAEHLESSHDMVVKGFMDSPIADETGVALYSHPLGGLSFCSRGEAFATALSTAARPDSDAMDLVREYLQDDSIPPRFIEQVIIERLPTSQAALAHILESPDFTWEVDGQRVLDQLPGELEPHNTLAILPLICRPEG